MTAHFQAPLTRQDIAARAAKLIEESSAFARLAADLEAFEAATGRAVLIVEEGRSLAPEAFLLRSGQAEQTATDRIAQALGFPEAEPHVEPNGVEIENAAQAEPIDAGSASTVTNPAPKRQNDYTRPIDAQDAPVTAHAAATPPAAPEAPKQPDTPPAASTAPRRAAPEVERRATWAKLSMAERRIVKHVESLPEVLTAQQDVQLVELLTSDSKIEAAAAFLQVDKEIAMARWKSFWCEDVIGLNGRPTFDGQTRLINALRYLKDAE